jgi:ligand-binding SRPBCC domain-containing protein
MKHRLEFEQWVPFPLELVFAFFSNPENLMRIMPEASATRLIALKRVPPPLRPAGLSSEKAAGVGPIISTSFRVFPLLPLRRRSVARITEFEWNRYFADVQVHGPFQSWHHRHEFASARTNGTEGTTIRDIIDYEVGFGFLGPFANALLIRPQMQSTFAERQGRLADLLR